MSNYTKSTNFTAKDTLPSGDSGKIVKGTEIDTEFAAVASAISSKADINSPTFTGTPLAPTASAGTNTTQIATTAFVQNVAGALGTISSQDADDVAITGGSISGVTMSSATLTSSTVNSVTVGSNASGTKTISSSSPAGGSSGDVWYKV